MNKRGKEILITLAVFVSVVLIGGFYISQSQFGYTESAILYLAGVLGAGLFWVGRK